VVAVDHRYLSKLQRYDRALDVIWNKRIDRFQVMRRARNGTFLHVMNITEPDGGFRPFDTRTIEYLKKIDVWRRFGRDITARQAAKELEKLDAPGEAIRAQQEQARKEEILEGYAQLRHMIKKRPYFSHRTNMDMAEHMIAVSETKKEASHMMDHATEGEVGINDDGTYWTKNCNA